MSETKLILTDSCYGFPTGQVQVEGSPVKVQLLDTAGQVRLLVQYHISELCRQITSSYYCYRWIFNIEYVVPNTYMFSDFELIVSSDNLSVTQNYNIKSPFVNIIYLLFLML